MIAQKQTFSDLTIYMDGCTFIGCHFDRCNLVYSGYIPTRLDGCSFSDCSHAFAGPAEAAILIMRGLYHGGGEGGRALVEGTFDAIRKPDTPQRRAGDPKIPSQH